MGEITYDNEAAKLIHECEKRAMTGDRQAVLKLVSVERQYRQALEKIVKHEDRGGNCPIWRTADDLRIEMEEYVVDLLGED